MKYIGKHITDDLNDSYLGSGIYLINAIKKYGKENFTKNIIFFFDNQFDMENKEKELVNESLVSNKNYYNISLGGQGGNIVLFEKHPLYLEYCNRISVSQKKRSLEISQNVKELHKQKKVGMYGRKQSDYQKETIRKLMTGKSKSKSSIEKQKISQQITYNMNGYIHPNTGRKASTETLKNMSIATKNRPKKTCQYCNKIMDLANYGKYHGIKCKQYEDEEIV